MSVRFSENISIQHWDETYRNHLNEKMEFTSERSIRDKSDDFFWRR